MGAKAVINAINPLTLISEWFDPIYAVSAEAGRQANQAAQNSAVIANSQAAVEDANAAIEQQRAEEEAAKRSRRLAADIGSDYANWAGNGLSVDGSGGDSLSRVVDATVVEGAADLDVIRTNAANKMWEHGQNARNYRLSAANMLEEGENAEEMGEINGLVSSASFAASVAASVFSFGATSGSSAAIAAGVAGTAASAASGVASLGNAYTSYRQGVAARDQAEAEAELARSNASTERAKAEIEQEKGETEADRRSRLLAYDIGNMYAGFAGNGISVDGGLKDTVTDATNTIVSEGVHDISTIRQNAAWNVWSHQQSANNYLASAEAAEAKGENAYKSGIMNMGVNIGKGLFSLGQAGYGAYNLSGQIAAGNTKMATDIMNNPNTHIGNMPAKTNIMQMNAAYVYA